MVSGQTRPKLVSRTIGGAVLVAFLLGLATRILSLNLSPTNGDPAVTRWQPIHYGPALERDERIYLALTEQLAAGNGYTLQG
ncbi:MAG TPA: hypothetical protein VFD66_08860, partial [Verrucomicrobiae bacterium]|nr:hypothetical protein [Verrucomicrobiae bacterium]